MSALDRFHCSNMLHKHFISMSEGVTFFFENKIIEFDLKEKRLFLFLKFTRKSPSDNDST